MKARYFKFPTWQEFAMMERRKIENTIKTVGEFIFVVEHAYGSILRGEVILRFNATRYILDSIESKDFSEREYDVICNWLNNQLVRMMADFSEEDK